MHDLRWLQARRGSSLVVPGGVLGRSGCTDLRQRRRLHLKTRQSCPVPPLGAEFIVLCGLMTAASGSEGFCGRFDSGGCASLRTGLGLNLTTNLRLKNMGIEVRRHPSLQLGSRCSEPSFSEAGLSCGLANKEPGAVEGLHVSHRFGRRWRELAKSQFRHSTALDAPRNARIGD